MSNYQYKSLRKGKNKCVQYMTLVPKKKKTRKMKGGGGRKKGMEGKA